MYRLREFGPTRYLRARLETARRPLEAILLVIAAAGVGAWIIGYVAGLLVVWLGSR